MRCRLDEPNTPKGDACKVMTNKVIRWMEISSEYAPQLTQWETTQIKNRAFLRSESKWTWCSYLALLSQIQICESWLENDGSWSDYKFFVQRIFRHLSCEVRVQCLKWNGTELILNVMHFLSCLYFYPLWLTWHFLMLSSTIKGSLRAIHPDSKVMHFVVYPLGKNGYYVEN